MRWGWGGKNKLLRIFWNNKFDYNQFVPTTQYAFFRAVLGRIEGDWYVTNGSQWLLASAYY